MTPTRERTKSGQTVWRVKYRVEKRRVRKTFRTREQAREWIEENQGIAVTEGRTFWLAWRALTSKERHEMMDAIVIMRQTRLIDPKANLVNAAKADLERRTAKNKSILLKDAYPLFLKSTQNRKRKGSVSAGWHKVLETCLGTPLLLPTSFTDVRYYLNCPRNYRFRKGFGFSPPIPEMFGFGKTVHTAIGKLHEAFAANVPTGIQAEEIAARVFHLKHMPPSGDPVNRPGGFERAKESASRILRNYATDFGRDFTQTRQVEVRFEIPARQAVITGAIDLLLKVGPADQILDASVVDFKAMEGSTDPEAEDYLHWTELSLQVQLYAKAAREVLGENARTGSVHLLKGNLRVNIPVDDSAVAAALANVEWAVDRILSADYPMRPHPEKCEECDFRLLCPQSLQNFATPQIPPPIAIPNEDGSDGSEMARAFSQLTHA